MTDDTNGLSPQMKARREELGLSQREVAASLGVVIETYSRWERGKTQGVLKHLPELADALYTTPQALLGLTGNGDQPADTLSDRVARLEKRFDAVEAVALEMREGVALLHSLQRFLADPEAVDGAVLRELRAGHRAHPSPREE